MMNKCVHTGNDDASKEEKYRNVLRELGIEKHKEEPITKEEFCYIFMHEQETIGMWS